MACDDAERDVPAIPLELVSRACLHERISNGRKKPLVLHADIGNAMRVARLESRLDELGVLRCFHGPGSAATTHTVNRCSEQRFTNLVTRADRSPTRTRRASW